MAFFVYRTAVLVLVTQGCVLCQGSGVSSWYMSIGVGWFPYDVVSFVSIAVYLPS